ncbi:MAG: hypothetical protein JXP34_12515 [Planctomycetes bacterium]|nr:hypothetical protein [Planctomycetota bacterium]
MRNPDRKDGADRGVSRRTFLAAASGAPIGARALFGSTEGASAPDIRPAGPASKLVVSIRATFVRRKGEYGMLWPGAVYDGEAARRMYTAALRKAERDLGLRIDLRSEPIHSVAEAKAWVEEAKTEKPDGLLVILLDRQQHAWPTARLAIQTGIPAVVYAPIGAAFTTNTAGLSGTGRSFIASTDDFGQAIYGLRMIRAHRRLQEMRYIVLRGAERRDAALPDLGTKLRYLPAKSFLDAYRAMPVTDDVRAMAADYIRAATHLRGTTEQDVVNGVKSYLVAKAFIEEEEGDAITMDCLGALGGTEVSLPCIAWSRMLDSGIPAACEADLNAATTHALILDLFGTPGFQQDPVPETAHGTLIGAHCTCATRLRGIDEEAEPFFLTYHHGKRDAVPRPMWKPGQRMSVAQLVLARAEGETTKLIISSGEVVENISVPPSGGCVVSVEVAIDGVRDFLDYPGFHQLFFYGDRKRDLIAYARMFGIEPVVV